ncbi:MAG: urease accessory protein UreF [Bradyrhizobiaceae bacterium]|nr:MAG: urease accessory protein UreF [Bradyrhizobiaceae bacterium]
MTAGEFPLHLFRLASPSLPVGAFSYSRGLESVIERGWVNDEQSAQDWILGVLEHIYAALDGPLFVRMMAALADDDRDVFLRNDMWLRAARESAELQLEDLRMGMALQRLLRDLDIPAAAIYADRDLSYPAAFAIAAHHGNVPCSQALHALMWSALEAQVAAAMRLVPLGQTSGQRIMIKSVDVMTRCAARALELTDDEIGNTAPSLAMASAWHEVQYTRLFRS